MDNKEQCRKLANRIYELDEKVYKTSGSGLGKTFTGEKARVLDDLTMLIVSNPQGHLLRSELALIGKLARLGSLLSPESSLVSLRAGKYQ